MTTKLFEKKDTISTYTSDQASNDGILFDISIVNPKWAKGVVNFVTTNLMGKGYMNDDGTINLPNLQDLLNQSAQIIKRKSKNFTEFDHFFSGRIELPSGGKEKIFMGQNETGSFTAMLPEDY